MFDFSTIAKGGWPQLMRMTADGKRMFITMNVAGRVAMFDTSDPEHPALLSVLDLGVGSGPHYLALTRDERRLVVSDYFLNEDSFGKVHQEGDHKVHVAKVTRHSLDARHAVQPRLQHGVPERAGAAARAGDEIDRAKEKTMSVQLGDQAPDFTAETTEGRLTFHAWKGPSWAVLFSHPRDFTPVCTTELGTLAGLKGEFDKRNTKVIGLSVDSLTSTIAGSRTSATSPATRSTFR